MNFIAESELTKEIKRALRGYASIMPSAMKTLRYAEEVDVGTGFVDFIRFEDYITNNEQVYRCRDLDVEIDTSNPICNRQRNTCNGCVDKSSLLNKRILGIATSCFEIKISKSDFKSKNGHNFVGNFNYYVMPKELYKDVQDLIPNNIGVVLYHGHGYLKKKKECIRQDITSDELNRYLYNALKKWVDACWLVYNNNEIESFIQ